MAKKIPYVLSPKDLGKKDIDLVGGKAANLAELFNADFPVPEAFFVTIEGYNKFLEHNDLDKKIKKIFKKLDYSDVKSLQTSTEEIRDLILEAKMPEDVKAEIIRHYRRLYGAPEIDIPMVQTSDRPFVAVRSSGATEDIKGASSAGQYETYLNIKGDQPLLDTVKKCWSSLYTARATYYRHKNKQPQEPAIGVVVQRMVNSEKSGVAFTIDPTDPVKGKNHIVIEACWGLGETLVQGEVEPDRYVVDKERGEMLQKIVGKKTLQRVRDLVTGNTIKRSVPQGKVNIQVLSDKEILALAAYCKKIENHYDFPEDIEWAMEKGRIYIVQARAVTTLKDVERGEEIQGTPILEGYGASPGVASGTVKLVMDINELDRVQKGDILVTKMTNPDYVVAMEKSTAIVTDEGGTTCHAAIVSRELGIPCIVATKEATKKLKEGMVITVDATHGKVYEGEIKVKKEKVKHLDIKTSTKVKVNVAFPQTAEKATHADGVGLMRLEHMLTETGMHPIEYIREKKQDELIKILIDGIGAVAKAFHPKPVWVRSLDARTDEFRHMKGGEKEPQEDNPMLGWHGIRRSLDEPEIIKSEFRAIKQLYEQGLDNIGIMLPFVIDVSELKKAKEIAKEVGLPDNVSFGLMIEVPSAALTIEQFCEEGIDFISFGSNDLTQTTLGIDRNNEMLIKLFNEMHDSMKFQFKHVIEICKKYGVKTSICGEVPSNRKDAVEFLIGAGIGSLSVNIDAIDKVREWVSEIES